MIVTHNNKLCEAFEEFSFTIAAMGNAHCTKEWRAKEISPPYTRLYYTLNGEGEFPMRKKSGAVCKRKSFGIPYGL